MTSAQYDRPIFAGDINALNAELNAMQRAAMNWLDTQPFGANDAGDALCDSAVTLSNTLTELIQYGLAPSVHGLIVIR